MFGLLAVAESTPAKRSAEPMLLVIFSDCSLRCSKGFVVLAAVQETSRSKMIPLPKNIAKIMPEDCKMTERVSARSCCNGFCMSSVGAVPMAIHVAGAERELDLPLVRSRARHRTW